MSERRLTAPLALLATLAPRAPDEDLERAVAYLGLDASAATVTRASEGAALPVALLVGGAAALVGPPVVAVALGAAAGLAAVRGVERAPVAIATMRRTRALGATADLVGRIAVRLRVEPSPERAAAVAARTRGGTASR